MAVTLDNTIGAMLVGTLCATTLWGVFCIQCWHYFNSYPNDHSYIKGLVVAIWVTDTVNQFLICASLYDYVISHFANQLYLDHVNWPLLIQVLFNGFTAVLVQSFFAYRIWKLSKHNIFFVGVVMLLVLSQWAVNIGYVSTTLAFTSFTLAGLHQKAWTVAFNATTVSTDVVIAILMCSLLWNSKTEFAKTNNVIDRLIMFSINTGLVTSLCAISSVTTYLTMPDTAIYIGIYYLIGRLYCNSLVATLNARSSLSSRTTNSDTSYMSYGMHDRTPSRTLGMESGPTTSRSNGVAVQIETLKDVSTGTKSSTAFGADDKYNDFRGGIV